MSDSEMMAKIKMVAPGTMLRRALDAILKADFGALIVFLDDIKAQENILQGGFYIGTGFSSEKLYELAKMDGAIILDENVSRILAANVQLAPDPNLPTNETGMRHRAAERFALQTSKFVLTISRRRRVIGLYYKEHKHQINDINYLLSRIDQTVNAVERYKENLDKKGARIEGDEFLDQVYLIQVLELIRDGIVILKLLADIEPYVVETGFEGRLAAMRLSSVGEDVASTMQLLVKDYCRGGCSDPEVHGLVGTLISDEPMDNMGVANCLGWSAIGEAELNDLLVRPRGYRLLRQVAKLPAGTADNLVGTFKNLVSLIQANDSDLMKVEGIGEKRAGSIIEGIRHKRRRSVFR